MKLINLNNSTEMLRANISQEEKESARKLAKSQGYTFQGWLGQIIKRELYKEVSDAQ